MNQTIVRPRYNIVSIAKWYATIHLTHKTLACKTFASLKKISPLTLVTLTVSLLAVVNVWPVCKKLEYKGCGIVWNINALVRFVGSSLESGLPAARNAASFGPRQVTLERVSRTGARPVR